MVVNAIIVKYSSLNTKWSVMNVRKLELPAAPIDITVDKETLDEFIHRSLWDSPDKVRRMLGSMLTR